MLDKDRKEQYRLVEECKKDDLPIPATFVSRDNKGLRVVLLPVLEHRNPVTGQPEREQGTGFIARFRYFKFNTRSSKVMELLMQSSAYKRGLVGPNPEDPTGFWRQLGAVEAVTREVIVDSKRKHLEFAEVDLKKIKAPEEPVKPYVVMAGP